MIKSLIPEAAILGDSKNETTFYPFFVKDKDVCLYATQ